MQYAVSSRRKAKPGFSAYGIPLTTYSRLNSYKTNSIMNPPVLIAVTFLLLTAGCAKHQPPP
jgi:hypothetical protein